MVNSHSEDFAEIRVHGIGHHEVWSALGSPPIIARPEPPVSLIDRINPVSRIKRKRQVSLAGPPEIVSHDLILVNWSRMSRNGSALVWFIAFPFTLINMAHEMQPAGGVRRGIHATVVMTASLVLTAITACWATAIVEAGLRIVNLPYFMDRWRPLGAVLIVSAVLIAILLFRPLVERESRWHAASALLHTGVVAAVGVFGYMVRPSEWTVPNSLNHWPFTLESPVGSQLETLQRIDAELDWSNYADGAWERWLSQYDSLNMQWHFDAVGSVSAISLVFMVLAATVLVCTARRRHPGAAGGAALAIIAAFTLTTLIMSCILSVLMPQLSSSTPQVARGPFGILGEDDFAQPYTVWLGRGYTVSDSTALLQTLSLLILAGLTLAFLLAVVVLRLRLRAQGRWVPDTLTPAARKAVRVHLTTERIGPVLWWTSTLAVITCLACEGFFVWYADRTQWCLNSMSDDECAVHTMNWGAPGLAASGVVAVILVFLIRRMNTTPAFKAKIEAVADIAGFWPITVQPLGARSYRPYAVAGICDAVLAEPPRHTTVLVGHSQGSVLAAWAVATCPELTSGQSSDLTLVTCGSPLRSLYAAFFPRWFDDEWFDNTRSQVAQWRNFWRETDPIAIPLQHNGITDIRIADPDPNHPETVRGHSDYWIATKQKTFVQSCAEPASRIE